MDHESEVIRQRMEETRVSLADKLQTLEDQVVDKVQGATTAVTDTVENVQEAVQETVATVRDSVQEAIEAVKEFLNLEHHVQRHPWLSFGGSVAVGYLGGCLLAKLSEERTAASLYSNGAASALSGSWPEGHQPNGQPPSHWPDDEHLIRKGKPVPPADAEPSLASKLTGQFGTELSKLKGLAIGTTMALVRDLVKQAVPREVAPKLCEVVDSITTKLGGEKLREPLV
jgi:ElaB/YqjD/DUF883 family membrane-anchored ribosome-binding protein